jgi:tRNA (adenine57-N1/adenine58-N1)-methyltransferase catalytic subunit
LDSHLKADDAIILIDRKGRRYLKILTPGRKLLIRGELLVDEVIGVEEGSRVKFSMGEAFLVLRPTYADLIPLLPRKAQVIYPKDTGPLVVWGDVFPGATVIEGGVGAGALTIALLRAVGPNGHLISYEIREDFAAAAKKNVATFFGEAPNWTLKRRDLYEGFDERGVDRMFLDLPEPERALDIAAEALRPGGVLICYVPTTVQLKETVDALQGRSDFGEIESFETMLRHWQVKGLSVRPHFRMVAHSAFIIASRRLAGDGLSAKVIELPLPEEPGIAEEEGGDDEPPDETA